MPRVLKQAPPQKAKLLPQADWQFWIFVAALVTIFGFFAQTHGHLDTDQSRRLQSNGDLYDMRIPNNNRMIHDRLETGR